MRSRIAPLFTTHSVLIQIVLQIVLQTVLPNRSFAWSLCGYLQRSMTCVSVAGEGVVGRSGPRIGDSNGG
jgi:hypothetical protein